MLKKFVKRNLVSFICVLMAFVMAVSGVISYAKFMSGENLGDTTGIGLFSYSATIDGVSALSFTNTAFWGGSVEEDQSEESLVAMNAIRTIDFNIKNFDENGNINAVRTGYSITFTAPKSFAEKLAFQVVDGITVPMTPQIVVSDILKGKSFSTSDSIDYNGDKFIYEVYDKNDNVVDENEEDGNGLYFKVTTSTVNGYTAYTATAKTPNGDFVITITQRTETKEQILQFRLWDVSSVTNESNPTVNYEGGRLISPLTVKVEEAQIFYDITVTTPDFRFPAGVATTRNHRVKLVPTEAIEDNHLGGAILDSSTGEQATVLYSGQDVLIQTISETVKAYSDQGKTNLISQETSPVFGSIKVYTQGMTNTVRTTSFISKTTEEPDTSDLSKATISTEEGEWTVSTYASLNVRSNNITKGTATGKVDSNNRKEYNITGTGTANVTFKRTVTTKYIFPIYETNTYAVTNTETYVISTAESDGYQIGAEIRERSTVTETYERKPIGSVIITKTEEYTTTKNNCSVTAIGTAYYKNNGNMDGDPSWNSITVSSDDLSSINTTGTKVSGSDTTSDPLYTTDIVGDVPTDRSPGQDKTTTVYKSISRSFVSHSMKIKEVSYTPANEDGTFGTTTVYTQDKPFSTMEKISDNKEKQIYFVSQCFLKSFPLSVNMTFEQRSSKD